MLMRTFIWSLALHIFAEESFCQYKSYIKKEIILGDIDVFFFLNFHSSHLFCEHLFCIGMGLLY